MKPSAKIINIRNILKIIIMVLIIFSMFKSCTYAYTFDDFVEFCEEIRDGTIPCNSGRLKNYGIPYFLANVNRIKAATNVDNYSNFVLAEGTFWYFSMNGGCTATKTSNNLRLDSITNPKWGCRINSSSIDTSYGNDPITSYSVNIGDSMGLVNVVNSDKGYFNLYVPYTGPEFFPEEYYRKYNSICRQWTK